MPITLEPIKNRKFIMKRVYSTKPENKGGVFLLVTILAGLFLVYGYVSILLDCSKISDIVIVSLILFAIFAWIYYFLDEAIWLMFGKEKCEYDDTKIVITKHRLFKRRKEIPWNEITDISLYSPGLIVELFTSADCPLDKACTSSCVKFKSFIISTSVPKPFYLYHIINIIQLCFTLLLNYFFVVSGK